MLVGDQFELEFEIGHRYQHRPNLKSADGRKAEHRCTPFMRIKDPALRPLINHLVHDVEFKLCECNNQNCENTIRKKPKCNNCENCLKKNGGWVEPNYEIACILNCWEEFNVPIKIYFNKELDPNHNHQKDEKCKCCDKKVNDLTRLPTFGTVHKLTWSSGGTWMTYKVQFNKRKFEDLMAKKGLTWMFQKIEQNKRGYSNKEYPQRLSGLSVEKLNRAL